ncbi:hypothetical protein PLICRDRAFT_173788 [Plicaturopsis crispa FD-325 SS-3]|nr:hypothetical protein PLICRDRAFT_173788 [Plicaturopsis crispa FD-325 SS-3]
MSTPPTQPTRGQGPIAIAPMTPADLEMAAHIQFTTFGGLAGDIFDPDPRVPLEVSTRRTAQRYKHYMESGRKVLVKAYLEDTGAVVGMAVWQRPGVPFKEPECEEKDMPEALQEAYRGMNMKDWKAFHSALGERRQQALGAEPYWYLYMLGVLPEHQGRGIGSKLLSWGIGTADSADPPLALYLEATPAGKKLYESRGFEVVIWAEVLDGKVKLPGMKRRAGRESAGLQTSSSA